MKGFESVLCSTMMGSVVASREQPDHTDMAQRWPQVLCWREDQLGELFFPGRW